MGCGGVLPSPGAAAWLDWSISPLQWLPPLANPSDCQEQDFSIPMRSDRSESPRSGSSFKLTGQRMLSSLSWPPSQCKERPRPPENRGGPAEWDGEMGSFLRDEGASEGVREDEMQFQLPSPDTRGVRVPMGPSRRRTMNPALKRIRWKTLGRSRLQQQMLQAQCHVQQKTLPVAQAISHPKR